MGYIGVIVRRLDALLLNCSVWFEFSLRFMPFLSHIKELVDDSFVVFFDDVTMGHLILSSLNLFYCTIILGDSLLTSSLFQKLGDITLGLN